MSTSVLGTLLLTDHKVNSTSESVSVSWLVSVMPGTLASLGIVWLSQAQAKYG